MAWAHFSEGKLGNPGDAWEICLLPSQVGVRAPSCCSSSP